MSALALLNLLNELRKSVIMRGLPSIVPLLLKQVFKFNLTGIQILSFYLSHGIKIAFMALSIQHFAIFYEKL